MPTFPLTIPDFQADYLGPCRPEKDSLSLTPLSLNDITDCILSASDDDRTNFYQTFAEQATDSDRQKFFQEMGGLSLFTPDLLESFWNNAQDQIYDAVGTSPIDTPLRDAINNGSVDVNCDPNTECRKWTVKVGFPILLTLGLTGGSGVGCNCERFELKIPGCNDTATGEPDEGIFIAAHSLPNPANHNLPYHQGNAYQVIINMISRLSAQLEYDCAISDWVILQGNYLGDGTQAIQFPVLVNYDLKFEVVANPNPARINWNPPEDSMTGGVQRFGKFVWTYRNPTDNQLEEDVVQFHNMQNQIFKKTQNADSEFKYFPNPGVIVNIYYRTVRNWEGSTGSLEQSF